LVRIKYTKNSEGLMARLFNIYGNEVIVKIKPSEVNILMIQKSTVKKNLKFSRKSLQTAKRKVRKILKEEFEVNLMDEIRKEICI
jgi:hypothetical protein